MNCPQCGASLVNSAKFCTKCGCKVEQAEDFEAKTVPLIAPRPVPQRPTTAQYTAAQLTTPTQVRMKQPQENQTSKSTSIKVVVLCAVMVLAAIAILWFFVISPANEIKSISAYPSEIELDVGESSEVVIFITPEKAEGKRVRWASDNPTVASVDDGMVYALAAGETTITVFSEKNPKVVEEIKVVVSSALTAQANKPSQEGAQSSQEQQLQNVADKVDGILYSASAANAYPNMALTDAQLSSMSARELQYLVNAIFAKNGYSFSTPEAQEFFYNMPWYSPVSNNQADASARMGQTDKNNLALLMKYRNNLGFDPTITGVDSLWTGRMADGALTESFVMTLDEFDVQLLAATVLAKRGYIFSSTTLQQIFDVQSFYYGRNTDIQALSLSEQDIDNLTLLLKYL